MCANFDIGARELVFAHVQICEIDILAKRHTAGLNLKDTPIQKEE